MKNIGNINFLYSELKMNLLYFTLEIVIGFQL
jgi:hypothetical protein